MIFEGKEYISEYEAALLIKMSPTLLRWFTKNAPKNDSKKLQYKISNGLYFYQKSELIDFDTHLNTSWPLPPKGRRPTIPKGIKDEIRSEAFFYCPVCHSNNNCEIAHIEAVSKTMNNHPRNLIYLCPNHHTEYDYGYVWQNLKKEDILRFKDYLQTFHSICWTMQSDIIKSYIGIINLIGRVKPIEDLIPQISQQEDFILLFQNFTDKIKTGNVQKAESPKVKSIINSTKKKNKDKDTKDYVYSFLSVKDSIKEELSNDSDLAECPLCNANGYTDYFEICPVCNGELFISKHIYVDLSSYELEECPLCDGQGYTDHYTICPPCHGEGKLTKEQISFIDFDRFELMDCPVCNGRGHTDYYTICPPCAGEGKISNEQYNTIDFDRFELIDCPLCDGKGYTDQYETCPPCRGEGKISNDQYYNIDFDQYNFVDCPVCDGHGYTDFYETCPPCQGEGKLSKIQIERIDFSEFKS